MKNALFIGTLLTFAAAAAGFGQDGRPVFAIVEEKDVSIASIDAKGKSILLKSAKGGTHRLGVVPKTWIIKDNAEATIDDLRVGQVLLVRYIPRTAQAVTIEVLPAKEGK